MAGKPGHAAQHLHRGDVEVGPLALPGIDEPVDLVGGDLRPWRQGYSSRLLTWRYSVSPSGSPTWQHGARDRTRDRGHRAARLRQDHARPATLRSLGLPLLRSTSSRKPSSTGSTSPTGSRSAGPPARSHPPGPHCPRGCIIDIWVNPVYDDGEVRDAPEVARRGALPRSRVRHLGRARHRAVCPSELVTPPTCRPTKARSTASARQRRWSVRSGSARACASTPPVTSTTTRC